MSQIPSTQSDKEQLERILDEYLESQWNGNMRAEILDLIAEETNTVLIKELECLLKIADETGWIDFPIVIQDRLATLKANKGDKR